MWLLLLPPSPTCCLLAAAAAVLSEEPHALFVLALALEGHAADALRVVHKAQLLVQPNNLQQ
jgi:hypothetical protein